MNSTLNFPLETLNNWPPFEGEASLFSRHPQFGYVMSVPGSTMANEFGESEGDYMYRHPRFGYVRSVPSSTIAKEFEDQEIIPPDQRVPVLNTVDVPYRWICHLDLNLGPDPTNPSRILLARGTGTLISPRHVLTAGHNLFDSGSDVKGVKVTPGYNCAGKIAAPFGSAVAGSWKTSPKWKPSEDPQFDFGLITLKTAIGEKTFPSLKNRPLGFWGSKEHGSGTRINPTEQRLLQGKPVNISGYPGDKCCFQKLDPSKPCKESSWAGAQFRASGKVVKARPTRYPRLIFYDLDTCGGHSGSPVWLRWQDFRNLTAIHTGPCLTVSGNRDCVDLGPGLCDPGNRRYSSNRGVLITKEVLDEIRRWMS